MSYILYAVFWSDGKDNWGFIQIAINIQTNPSGPPQRHDLQPLQVEIWFFHDFQLRQASKLFDTFGTFPEGTLAPIFHQDSSCCQQQD